MPLSDTAIRKAKPTEKNYRLHDGQGLYLDVRKSGKKIWRLRTREQNRDTYHTLGQYPGVSLSEARKKRDGVKSGSIDLYTPRSETFKDIANEWFESKSWSEYYTKQVCDGLNKEIYPAIGNKEIKKITARDVLSIMNKINDRGAPSVAKLVRQWIAQIFSHAIRTLRVDSDPTQALRGAVQSKRVKHATALNQEQFKKLIRDIDNSRSYRTTQIAMHLLMLTMLRTIEVRRAEWSEVDLDKKTWVIPEAKMKRRIPHIVPLSDQAIELLKELKSITGSNNYLFPNNRNPKECMTPTTINTALVRKGWGNIFSAHGFRATSSTILNQNGWRGDLIEKQLSHEDRDRVRGSYNHADYIDERREMLAWWADYIDKLRKENNDR